MDFTLRDDGRDHLNCLKFAGSLLLKQDVSRHFKLHDFAVVRKIFPDVRVRTEQKIPAPGKQAQGLLRSSALRRQLFSYCALVNVKRLFPYDPALTVMANTTV
jgi:hypothetical protein